MTWRSAAPAVAALLLELAAAGCAGTRRWTEDESDRIDAVMAAEASPDAGEREDGPEPLVAMGPSPPLAEPTSPREQLSPATPWSQPPWRRGTRWYLGRRKHTQFPGAATR